MCLGHVYIVLEPVGSARLKFDDDLYYELCVFGDRRLFGVPDEITDMTRSLEMVERLRLIYWTIVFGHRNGSGGTGYILEYRGLPEPPEESNAPTWAIWEREGSPR